MGSEAVHRCVARRLGGLDVTSPDALLTAADRMEALSLVYIRALAARAGYMVSGPEPDRDSVDLTLSAGGHMRPQIGIQAKATTTIAAGVPQFSFPLKLKNYNDLRIETLVPRILVVFAMPKEDADWFHMDAERLLLRRCAYWKSLQGMQETDNETKLAVSIDTSQVLDVQTLVTLMDKSRKGESL